MGRVQALKWPVQRSCTNPVSCAKAALPPQSDEPRASQQGFRVAIRIFSKKRGWRMLIYLPGSCAAPGHMFARSHWAPLLGEVLALHVQHFWFIEKLWLGAFSCVPTADDLWRLSDNLMTALNSRQLFSFVLVDQITCVENSGLYTSDTCQRYQESLGDTGSGSERL